MHDIRKILLATSQNQQSRNAELRAALLSAQLDVGAFDMIALRHSRRGVGTPLTTFSHLEVGCGALRAWVAGERRPFVLPDHPDAVEALWNVEPKSAASVVVGRAEEMAADLTILAPQRRNAFLKMIAGSDSDEIVRRSRNAVLVVHREPAEAYRRVLVAVDFSQDAFDAARIALALAPGAHFTFLHAYSLPDEGLMREFEVPASVIQAYLLRGVDSARERLSAWIDALKPMRQPRARAVHSGLPVPVIRSCARRIGADLIVAGRQGHGIASAVYRWWLDGGRCLVSGARQSAGAHALWRSLAAHYGLLYVDVRDKTLCCLGREVDARLREDLHTRMILLGRDWDLARLACRTGMRAGR